MSVIQALTKCNSKGGFAQIKECRNIDVGAKERERESPKYCLGRYTIHTDLEVARGEIHL